MEFVALDVETANAECSSICQIGIAHFRNGSLEDEWVTYVDPEDFFDDMNVSIHGINELTVREAPRLPEIAAKLHSFLDGRITVAHTHFDRVAINQGCLKYQVRAPLCTWLDSARVVRRTWEQFSRSGYGLQNVSQFLSYQFQAHDALEDAKAAGHIMIAAIDKSGLDLQGWLKRVEQPIGGSIARAGITRDGNPLGALYGEVLVFTGALELPRREAAKLAAEAGCTVGERVGKDTTILVVGDQDIRKLVGHQKSSKHRTAEQLIMKGQPIRILRESDFRALVALASCGYLERAGP